MSFRVISDYPDGDFYEDYAYDYSSCKCIILRNLKKYFKNYHNDSSVIRFYVEHEEDSDD